MLDVNAKIEELISYQEKINCAYKKVLEHEVALDALDETLDEQITAFEVGFKELKASELITKADQSLVLTMQKLMQEGRDLAISYQDAITNSLGKIRKSSKGIKAYKKNR